MQHICFCVFGPSSDVCNFNTKELSNAKFSNRSPRQRLTNHESRDIYSGGKFLSKLKNREEYEGGLQKRKE